MFILFSSYASFHQCLYLTSVRTGSYIGNLPSKVVIIIAIHTKLLQRHDVIIEKYIYNKKGIELRKRNEIEFSNI